MRAAADQQLSVEEDVPLELADARAGSFSDALGALEADGGLVADRFERELLTPFVLETCLQAARRASERHPQAWQELLDELGEDDSDLPAVVRAAEWDAPLRTEAETLVLAAIGRAPLVEVEAEGLPLSLVRAAEAVTRAAAAPPADPVPSGSEDDLAGALFLAGIALEGAALELPVRPVDALTALTALLAEGIEPDEVLQLLPHLPVMGDTADVLAAEVRDLGDAPR